MERTQLIATFTDHETASQWFNLLLKALTSGHPVEYIIWSGEQGIILQAWKGHPSRRGVSDAPKA